MAANISGASSLPDRDYSIHRAPPPIPPTSPRHRSSPPPDFSPQRQRQRQQQHDDAASDGPSDHRRRPSFGVSNFLRRTASGRHKDNVTANEVPPLPLPLPLPTTRSAQVAHAHQHVEEGRISTSSSSRKPSSEGRSMLRKSSKLRQEQDRQAREAERVAAMNRPPPRLPELPQSFVGDPHHQQHQYPDGNPRPDSVAIFNSQSHYHAADADAPPVPRAGTNFSRPSPANMPPSSSPAYAVRGGSAYAGSSPNVPGKVNGSREYVSDPVERTESMTNRGRYSYASSVPPVNVSSPRRVRRRKDPTPFNVLVVGAKNSGKTSLISFLRHSLALPSTKQVSTPPESSTYSASKSSFTSHYLETEMEGERVGLTLWDSAGLEKNIVDLQLREMATFVESKFEETFVEEQKVMRSPGAKDTHIHCVFLVLDPVRLDGNIQTAHKGSASLDRLGGLDDELDLQALRVLWGKTTVIPIVAKADTLTSGHMAFLKRAVWQSIKSAKLDPLEALELEDDLEDESEEEEDSTVEDDDSSTSDVIDNLADNSSDENAAPKATKATKKSHNRASSLSMKAATATVDDETPYIPMSILSPDPYDLPPYVSETKSSPIGRRFPWGFADPYNAEHCDFTRLRDSVFSEWRGELRDLSRSRWYENWRTSRLNNVPNKLQRVRGGVTPLGSVPREGRSSPKAQRGASGGSAVPRSVSGGAGAGGVNGGGVADGRSTGLESVREAAA